MSITLKYIRRFAVRVAGIAGKALERQFPRPHAEMATVALQMKAGQLAIR